MQVKVLKATHPDMIVGLSTQKLRSYYLLTDMFAPDDIRLSYSHVERLIAGGAMPQHQPLKLEAVREAGSNPFLARRELGLINIGGPAQLPLHPPPFPPHPPDAPYFPLATPHTSLQHSP